MKKEKAIPILKAMIAAVAIDAMLDPAGQNERAKKFCDAIAMAIKALEEKSA